MGLEPPPPPNERAPDAALLRLVVVLGAHIEGVFFLFSDGHEAAFTPLAAMGAASAGIAVAVAEAVSAAATASPGTGMLGTTANQTLRARSGASSHQLLGTMLKTASATTTQGAGQEARASGLSGQTLELSPGEHLLEVSGINSQAFCESIVFRTSHGRTKRLDTHMPPFISSVCPLSYYFLFPLFS